MEQKLTITIEKLNNGYVIYEGNNKENMHVATTKQQIINGVRNLTRQLINKDKPKMEEQ